MSARVPMLPKPCVTCGEFALPYPRRGECNRCYQRGWRDRNLDKVRTQERESKRRRALSLADTGGEA